MKMVRVEKWFINKPHHATQAINRAEKLLHFVNVQEKQNFLEVGCGNGAVSKYVAQKYRLNVNGVDIDPEQIQFAQENIDDIPNIHFLVTDATGLPFPDNNFDIVLSFGVTHHISNWLDALGEIRRVLRPKGYFIYFDFVYPKLIAKFGRSFKHSYGITTMSELNSFIQDNGLSTIHSLMKNSLIWRNCEFVYQRS
jgi:ubiquinone/menaquinone biosynthesis C-methylase UbiE